MGSSLQRASASEAERTCVHSPFGPMRSMMRASAAAASLLPVSLMTDML